MVMDYLDKLDCVVLREMPAAVNYVRGNIWSKHINVKNQQTGV